MLCQMYNVIATEVYIIFQVGERQYSYTIQLVIIWAHSYSPSTGINSMTLHSGHTTLLHTTHLFSDLFPACCNP